MSSSAAPEGASVPWSEIDTVFLDAGNVLASLDFDRIASALREAGLDCGVEHVERAEAAARPVLSAELTRLASTEADETFAFYMRALVGGLPGGEALAGDSHWVTSFAKGLKREGRSDLLWCRPMHGVPEALSRLRGAGLRLAVVSNADGTIRANLEARGFAGYMDEIFDSFLVGFEKPDRRFFEHALAETGADPARTVHVGDMYHADVVGARSAGIHPILLDPFGDWPDTDCTTLQQLTDVALRLAP